MIQTGDTITLSTVLEWCKSATMLTIFQDGELSIFRDDIPNDRRIVARVPNHRRYVTITALSGYDAEKHCWEKEHGSDTFQIPNKRGQKALDAWTAAINERFHYVPRPKIASYYRREGELRP